MSGIYKMNKDDNRKVPIDDEKEIRCIYCCLPKPKEEYSYELKSGEIKSSKYCLSCREMRNEIRKNYYQKNKDELVLKARESRKIKEAPKRTFNISKCEICEKEVKYFSTHLKSKQHIQNEKNRKEIEYLESKHKKLEDLINRLEEKITV
jgi:hypothetical protein